MKEIKIKNNFISHFFIILTIFNIILNECEREKPIVKEKLCQLIYCDKEEYSASICEINNSIIRNQWLTNIIKISDKYYRYINIAFNTQGDMFIETSANTTESKRIFYGLKNNGRPYFKNKENNRETPFYIMNEMNMDLKRHESELINIILNNDKNSEYLMSVSVDGFVEIYDFENGERKYISTFDFFQYTPLALIHYSVVQKNDNFYYILIPFYCYDETDFGEGNFFYLKRYNFNSMDITKSNSYQSEQSYPMSASEQKILSCFLTNSLKVGCFFLEGYESSYTLYLFDPYFNYIAIFTLIHKTDNDPESFFKGVHLKGEIIAFYYYLNSDNDYGHLSLYNLDTIDYSNVDMLSGNNYVGSYNDYNNIIINKISFYTSVDYNDFIKLDDNKLCILSFTSEKNIYNNNIFF